MMLYRGYRIRKFWSLSGNKAVWWSIFRTEQDWWDGNNFESTDTLRKAKKVIDEDITRPS